MNQEVDTNQKDFHEWMITQALCRHLREGGAEFESRMKWFFGLEAQTEGNVVKKMRDVCGFDWRAGETDGKAEKPFGLDERGTIEEGDFKKRFWGRTPDFHYWTPPQRDRRDKQLIIEAKGTVKPSKKDAEQAMRYFEYLKMYPCEGAVVYFVPYPDNWLGWLKKQSGNGQIPWGIVDIKTQIVPRVASELIRVVGETLVKTADMLEGALQLPSDM